MKYSELQNRDMSELQIMLKEQRVVLGKLRFELANKTLKDFSKLQKTGRDIAKILTAITDANKDANNANLRIGK